MNTNHTKSAQRMTTTMSLLALVLLGVACGAPELAPNSLRVDSPLRESTPGASLRLRATGKTSQGVELDVGAAASWESSDPTVASFETGGVLHLNAAGTVSLSASYEGQRATTTLKVLPVPLRRLDLVPNVDSLLLGHTQQFRAVATRADGLVQDVTTLAQWRFSNSLQATGLAGEAISQAVGVGTASVQFEGLEVQRDLAVYVDAQRTLFLDVSNTLRVDDAAPVRLLARSADGTEQDLTGAAQWSTTADGVATVQAADLSAQVTGLGAGLCVISAVFEGVRTSAMLTVVERPVVAMAFEPRAVSLAVGHSATVAVYGMTDHGARVTLEGVSFAADDQSLVRVTSSGQVLALRPGLGGLVARWNGLAAWLSVQVSNATLDAVRASLPTTRLAVGDQVQLVITGVLSDGTTVDLTKEADAVSGRSVTVAHDGQLLVLSAKAPGIDQVLVHAHGREVVLQVEVTTERVTSLRVQASRDATQAQAFATWTDGRETDVTEQAQWEAEGNASIGTSAGKRGALTFVGAGEATLVSSFAGQKAALVVAQ